MKNSRRLIILLFLGSLVALMATSCTTPAVSQHAIAQAKSRLKKEVGRLPSKGTLVVVDYSKPSSAKRMAVVDLRSGACKTSCRVAHGVNSGHTYATNFSNRPGSRKSSLGLYKVAEEYRGKHGTSFRLDGLDPYNDRARERGIVVHSAEYATYDTMLRNRNDNYRLGRSAGCFAVSPSDLNRLESRFDRGPSYVFAFSPDLH